MITASNDADYNDPNMFFKYWSEIAKTDPERFERERSAEIEKVISKAPEDHQQGLRQLQWIIDGKRRRAKNPIDAMLRLNKMMMDHVHGDHGLVSTLPLWAEVSKNLVDIGTEINKVKEDLPPPPPVKEN